MKYSFYLPILLLFFSIAPHAAADVVYLTNGDRISGEFTGLREGSLHITTSYAGELTVDQAEAIAIETGDAWTIETATGDTYEGQLTWKDGALAVQTGGGRSTVNLADVIFIGKAGEARPTPEEPAADEAEKVKIWSGSADLGMTIKSGTTDTTDVIAKLQFIRTRPVHTLTLSAAGNYGEVESEIHTRRYMGNVELRLTPWEHFYTFGYSGIEHDAGRQLELRWTTGAGLGYTLISNDRRLWEAEAGLEYAREEWNLYSLREEIQVRDQFRAANLSDIRGFLVRLRDNPVLTFNNVRNFGRLVADVSQRDFDNTSSREDDINLRFATHYEQQVFEKSRFFADFEYVPAIDDWTEFRFISSLAWQTPLREGLSLRLNLLSEYESDPQGFNIDDWENTFTTSLRYEF
jgi:putative salt-induced outer membrane protein YdiY